MKTGLSYGDVQLIPRYNNVESRTDPTFETMVTKRYRIKNPILAANMDTIIGPALAEVLVAAGSVPIFHRFYRDDQDTVHVNMPPRSQLIDLVRKYEGQCFISWGATELATLFDFITKYNLAPLGVCIDIAHGHSAMAKDSIMRIKERFPELDVIAGNVCTAEAVMDLVSWGADAVKVGIGPGSACTTRRVTAFGAPQFTAVQECAKVGRQLKVPVIADGGIKGSREIALALAAGASTVMIGGLFAETFEAAGKGQFRGQASQAFQNDYFGGVKKGTVPEGVSRVVIPRVGAADEIEDLLGGLRSSMTYGGAKDLEEFHRKAEFIQVTHNYWG
jgi:IMP dehydrogenase